MYTLHPPSNTVKHPSRLAQEGSAPVRVVGPGRRERAYQARIADLSHDLELSQGARNRADRELEVARLVERGTRRFVDRLEDRIGLREEQARRALVLAGSLQRTNQLLEAKIARLENQLGRLAAPKRTS
ncbi:MAG: hypothetical protein KDB61_16030, partial [Planctomycetes bacterium]|nr:hypothetical protein [Planctomycetota bacterium]